MIRARALVALAALPPVALAQPGGDTRIVLGVRPWGSPPATPFVEHLDVFHPDFAPAEIEVGVMYYRSAGFGLGSVVHNIVGTPYDRTIGDSVTLLDRTDSAIHPDGRLGTFNFGGQFQVVYTNRFDFPPYGFRVSANGNLSDNPAGGISVRQNTPAALGSNFDSSDGVLAYHLKVTFACDPTGAPRTLTIDAPRAKINSFAVYSTAQSTTLTSIIDSLVDARAASVTISAPAPASLAILLAAPLIASRRRAAA